jgi:hypothetical protein
MAEQDRERDRDDLAEHVGELGAHDANASNTKLAPMRNAESTEIHQLRPPGCQVWK